MLCAKGIHDIYPQHRTYYRASSLHRGQLNMMFADGPDPETRIILFKCLRISFTSQLALTVITTNVSTTFAFHGARAAATGETTASSTKR